MDRTARPLNADARRDCLSALLAVDRMLRELTSVKDNTSHKDVTIDFECSAVEDAAGDLKQAIVRFHFPATDDFDGAVERFADMDLM